MRMRRVVFRSAVHLNGSRDALHLTDGRAWPAQLPGASLGYSIGRWIDTDGDGRYDKSSRIASASRRAMPRSCTTRSTVIDDALTRPWTVMRSYQRDPAVWEYVCSEGPAPASFLKDRFAILPKTALG